MRNGFGLIECIVTVVLLSIIVWNVSLYLNSSSTSAQSAIQTIHDSRQSARVSNASQIQDAFERAKLTDPDILTNTSVQGLVNNPVLKCGA